jgi:O-antigen/teichoic acid export membrane protein
VKRHHVSEAAWVGAGQVATAVGTVVGIRLLTQFLEPATFGTITLILGVVALALNIVGTPLTQAALHFYPEFAQRQSTLQLRDALFRSLRRVAPWLSAALVIGGAAWIQSGAGSVSLVLLIAALLGCDIWRSANHSILNAARLHRRYGSWLALEAWGRPLAATAAVVVFGASVEIVLAAYILASVVLILVFRHNPAWQGSANDTPADKTLDRRVWRYALPLMPLGVVGWANGLSDRYIIGALLSLQDAGIYAAVYGLASRPLLLMNAAIEQALRPVYQSAVSARHDDRATRAFTLWLEITTAGGALVVAGLSIWHREIANLLLGEAFRSGSKLIPWIAAGYALLCVSYVFERVCYAHALTQRVLVGQSLTAVAAVVATTFGVLHWGLMGAAAAVPVYFSVQLITAMAMASRTSRQVRLAW